MVNQKCFRRALVLFAAGLCLVSCAEDTFNSKVTSIDGQVTDLDDNPIFGVKIGVLYSWNILSASALPGAVGVPFTAGVTTVYPNPIETSNDVNIRVSVSEPTTARVEIRGFELGITGTVALIFDGRIAASDTTLTWDGRDGFTQELVPNGLYLVRLTSPLNGDAVNDESILVNRSAAQMEVLDAFNAVSGADGDYVLDDLAVGRAFTRTSVSGQNQGAALLASRVTLVFRDPDYLPVEDTVDIGPNETVTKVTRLTPVIPGPQPLPDAE